MIDILQAHGYRPPIIIPGRYGRLDIKQDIYRCCFIHIDGEPWMVYNKNTHEQVYEVYSHYSLAHGHVIVTGMGFGARENWLLTRHDVTKLTIIERSLDIIGYHESIRSPFMSDSRVEIINQDALTYRGTCDVLLLDHYEMESYDHILSTAQIIQRNISCDVMWFWPLERIIMHARRWYSQQDNMIITKQQAYQQLRDHHALDRLPDLSAQQVDLYCMMASSHLFSRSENILDTTWPGIDANWEIYGRI